MPVRQSPGRIMPEPTPPRRDMMYRQQTYMKHTVETRERVLGASHILEKILAQLGSSSHTMELKALDAIKSCYLNLKNCSRASKVSASMLKFVDELIKGEHRSG